MIDLEGNQGEIQGWDQVHERVMQAMLAPPTEMVERADLSEETIWDWEWNIQTNSIRFSDRLRTWLGYGQDEFRNCFHDWMDKIHPDDFPAVADACSSYINQSSQTLKLTFRLRAKTGEYRRYVTNAHSLREGGATLSLFGNYSDVTEERAVIEFMEEFREMLHLVPHGVGMLDLSGRYVYVNQACASALGYTQDELIGSPWGQQFHPDDLEALTESYEKMQEQGMSTVRCRRIHKEGHPVMQELMLIKRQASDSHEAGHFLFCREAA